MLCVVRIVCPSAPPQVAMAELVGKLEANALSGGFHKANRTCETGLPYFYSNAHPCSSPRRHAQRDGCLEGEAVAHGRVDDHNRAAVLLLTRVQLLEDCRHIHRLGSQWSRSCTAREQRADHHRHWFSAGVAQVDPARRSLVPCQRSHRRRTGVRTGSARVRPRRHTVASTALPTGCELPARACPPRSQAS